MATMDIKLKRVAIIDVDDIIFFTTSLWYDRIYNNPSIFKDYIDPRKILIPYDYRKDFLYNYNRETYYFSDWLLREDLSEEDKKTGCKLIMDIFTKDNFYSSDKLLPTSTLFYLKKVLQYNQFGVEKLVFVTRTFPEHAKAKINIIRDYFKEVMSNIDIIIVEPDEKKSDAIKEYEDIAMIFDDELKNIKDYLENSEQLKYTQIFIPSYGYNSMNTHQEEVEYLVELAEKNNNSINYYEVGNLKV